MNEDPAATAVSEDPTTETRAIRPEDDKLVLGARFTFTAWQKKRSRTFEVRAFGEVVSHLGFPFLDLSSQVLHHP